MSKNSIIGRFEGNTSFRTSKGLIKLTSLAPGDSGSVDNHPFPPAREFEGHYAILNGVLKGKVFYDAELDELVPPKASEMVTKLIEGKVLDMARLREELEAAQLTLVGEELEVLDVSSKTKAAIPSSGPLPMCALIVGHRESDKGTRATFEPRTWEWDYNREMAELVAERVQNVVTEIVFRDDNKSGYSKLPAKVNALNPDFIVSLHCNAVDYPEASGTEMLYYHTSKASKKLAKFLQKEVLNTLGLKNRKTRPKTSNDRGGHLLKNTKAPAVITEPFFMSNPDDWKAGRTRKKELAAAYARAIDAYAATLTKGSKSKTVDKAVSPRTTEDSGTISLQHDGLSKEQFFKKNRKALDAILEGVNGRLRDQYGAGANPITRGQAWAVMNAEMGLSGGKVDAHFRHSEGERGMFPLPQNVKFWNGKGAPAWDKPHPLVRNVEEFMFYLGQLKNKNVTKSGSRVLYRDLFKEKGIAGSDKKEMHVLGGVVHGYFYSGTYSDKKVPLSQILGGITAGKRIPTVMAGTKYKHAGKTLMVNRERNLEDGFGLA